VLEPLVDSCFRENDGTTKECRDSSFSRRRKPIAKLRILGFVLGYVLLQATVPALAAGDATSETAFSWRIIPATTVLSRNQPFASDCFRFIKSEGSKVLLRFDWNNRQKPYPSQGERFHSVIVVPPGGVLSATSECGPACFLKGGALVQPATPPLDSLKTERLKTEVLGEYRGAELVRVEFRPSLPVGGNPQVDASFTPTSILTLNLKNPFGSSRPINPLVLQSFQVVVLNPEDLPRCLPSATQERVISEERLQGWRGPAVKIRTSSAGWYGIPVNRLLPLLGEGARTETLRLSRRAPLIEAPVENRDPDDDSRMNDLQEPFGIRILNEDQFHGGLPGPSEVFVFHADLSTSPYDPKECYWLTSDITGTTSPDRIMPLGLYEIGIPTSLNVPSATIESVVGKDRVFVEGGLRTSQQAFFWVDREFPEQSGEPLEIPLPQWTRDTIQPVEANLRVIFGSSMKENYSAEDHLKQGQLALSIGAATFTYSLEKQSDGYGYTASFRIPQGVTGEALAVRYLPETPSRNPLYFDDLHLRGATPLVWSGSDVIFRNPSSPILALEDRATDGSLPLAFGRTQEGQWGILNSHRHGKQIALLQGSPGGGLFTEVHLFRRFKEVDELVSYHLPRWLESPPQADQLVLTPSMFQGEVNTLIAEAAKGGLKYVSIDLSGIFDLFSGGQFSPFAVRNFLSWVGSSWPDPQPASALLIGDSSWDTWGRFPHSQQVPNLSPSYHTPQHPDYTSDLWFVEGRYKDRVADWFFGRMPCQTSKQLLGYLRKLEAQGKKGDSRRLIWVTDDNPPFERNTHDVFLQSLPLAMRLDHIRIRDYPFVDNFYYGTHLAKIREEAMKTSAPLDYGKISPECNEAIRKSLNQGAGMFVYFGHSGLNVLGHERVLFGGGSKFSDIPSLTNLERSPLAFLMTCDVGRFDFAEIPKWSVGLAEEMLFHGNGGCMALFTSTGRGLPSDHLALLKGCLDMAIRGEVLQPGALLWGGKTECQQAGMPNQSVDMFTLLGDPLYSCPLPRSRTLTARQIRWNREGTLDIHIDLAPLFEDASMKAAKTASCWQVGDDLREENSWDHIPVTPEGSLHITLPNARDLQEVFLGIQLDRIGNSSPPDGKSPCVGTLALDLSQSSRPDWKVSLADDAKPDLSLDLDRILFENYSTRNGETIFIRATVKNEGGQTAEEVSVKGFAGSERKGFSNFANYPETKIRRLDPDQSETVRLRWDWWEGTGDQNVTVVVDPDNVIAESNESNNEAGKTIHILEKPDLGWGLIRDCTSAQTDFSRVTSVPANWVIDPTRASLGSSSPFRPLLHDTDRAAMLEVPLCNFGETSSTTTTLEFRYWHQDQSEPFLTTQSMVLPPLAPSLTGPQPKGVPVLLVPGSARIEIEVDPDGGVDERTLSNNTIEIVPPAGFWDRMPVLRQKHTLPKALERFKK
jgi:hypothetical protein